MTTPTTPSTPSGPSSPSAPTANSITPAAFDEDTQSLITLSYTDPGGHQATACSISSPNHISVTQACSCSAGVCTVGVTGTSNFNGSASFSFNVTANSLTSSNANATLSITAVPDITGTLTHTGIAITSRAKQTVFSGLSFDENISKAELCLSQDSNSNGVLDAAERCNLQNFIDVTSPLGAAGTNSGASWASYSLQNGVNSASINITPSCSTTTNYFTTLRVTNSVGKTAVIDSAAWSFWSPSCLAPNLVMWFDASDSSSLFSNTACTTAAVDNGPVACWKDKSGNNNNVTQATPSLQPTYLAASNKINFNGTTVLMGSTASNPYSVTGDRGLFTLFKLNTAVPTGGYIVDRSTVTQELFGIFNNGQLEVRNNAGGSYIHFGPAVSIGVPVNWGGTLSGATATQFIDGSLTATSSTTGVINQPGVSIGRHVITTTSCSIDFNEYIFINVNPSASVLSKIQGYLAWKWGAQGNLPAGHAYKNSAP
ncbi:MAG: hypothetical protein ACXWQQ_00115 [Pseudobdellovibrio sp.]